MGESAIIIYNVAVVNRGRVRSGAVVVDDGRIAAVDYGTDGVPARDLLAVYPGAAAVDGGGPTSCGSD